MSTQSESRELEAYECEQSGGDASLASGDPPNRCWMEPTVEVRESHIHGLGLFATTDLREGTVVAVLGGQVITGKDLDSLDEPYSSVGLGGNRHLLIDPMEPVTRGNHSCDPNLWMRGQLVTVARRDIHAGEELTVDYATQTTVDTWTMKCNCRSAGCRQTIRGSDWQRSELQASYGDHWTPELLERMEQFQSPNV